jgi:putative transposase
MELRQAILKSHTAAPSYGVDNVHADVREKLICGRNRVRRLMREMGVRSERKRRYKATTNSAHGFKVAPNLIKGLIPLRPSHVWVSDISYIPTEEGWLYLAIVKDKFTREIVGYSTSDSLNSSIALKAMSNAIASRHPSPGLIHHSDRGIQYCCNDYQELLVRHAIQPSMSRKGNPFDNAMAENFFSCIKCEMIYLNRFQTRHEADIAVFGYIEGFYNRRRRHSALGRISPAEFRKRWEGKTRVCNITLNPDVVRVSLSNYSSATLSSGASEAPASEV